MEIICPHCQLSKDIDPARLPDRPVKVSCPRCKHPFSFDKQSATATVLQQDAGDAAAGEQPGASGQVICPVCGLLQPAGETCQGCGIIYTKWQAHRQAQNRQTLATTAEPIAGASERPEQSAPEMAATVAETRPKAGFWIRFIAYAIDGTIVGFIQLAIGWLFESLLFIMGEGQVALAFVSGLLALTISFVYGVYFIGYCGQTPGKMLLRIKVIRRDGATMTYGRAFVREVPGKFVSGILFGIGYLMVAFDSQKQGLHDKIADTYVIKL